MKIAIDIRPLMGGYISGVEKYIACMLKAILELDSKNEYILWYNAFHSVELSYFPQNYSNIRIKRTRWPNKLLNFSLSLFRWPKLDRLIEKGIEVLWVPDPRPAPVSKKCQKITTFHDLSFEEFKKSFNRKTRLWHRLVRPQKEAEEADHIIAVSHFTRNKLTTLYRIPASKIAVIHEAVPFLFHSEKGIGSEKIKEKYDIQGSYFLCLSTLEPRKNIQAVIRAFLDFKKKTGLPTQLIIAGKGRPDIFTSETLSSESDIRQIGFVEEADKPALYQNALAFIYPSFYEGFGLPILEAMEYGTAVITSNTSSLPEVAGEATLFIDPKKPEQIQLAMERICTEPDLRDELIEKGRRQVATFSWKKAALEFLSLIKKNQIS